MYLRCVWSYMHFRLTRRKMIKWEQQLQMSLLGRQLEEVICFQSGSWWPNKLSRSGHQLQDHPMHLEKGLQNAVRLQRGAILRPSELVKRHSGIIFPGTLYLCSKLRAHIILSISGGTERQGKGSFANRHSHGPQRTVSVKDVICVLEREPQMTKSRLIYRLYERLPGESTD